MKISALWKMAQYAVALNVVVFTSAFGQSLNFKTLDNPAGVNGTILYGINTNGQITGTFYDSNKLNKAFVFSGGAFTTLFPNVAETDGLQINNSGVVVGEYLDSGKWRGYIYQSGALQFVDVPGGINGAQITGVNDLGQAVGEYANGAINQGFLYDQGNLTYPLNPCGLSQVNGINSSGVIVGNCGDHPRLVGFSICFYTDHGFVFDPSTNSVNPLSYPGSDEMCVHQINNFGKISGYYHDGTGYHGFVYDSGTFTSIDYPGAAGNTFVKGINDNGSVVGFYLLNGVPHGFVAEAPAFVGKPDDPDCHGDSVTALVQQYGKIPAAATALGYRSVQGLQMAITAYCRG